MIIHDSNDSKEMIKEKEIYQYFYLLSLMIINGYTIKLKLPSKEVKKPNFLQLEEISKNSESLNIVDEINQTINNLMSNEEQEIKDIKNQKERRKRNNTFRHRKKWNFMSLSTLYLIKFLEQFHKYSFTLQKSRKKSSIQIPMFTIKCIEINSFSFGYLSEIQEKGKQVYDLFHHNFNYNYYGIVIHPFHEDLFNIVVGSNYDLIAIDNKKIEWKNLITYY